MWRADSFEKTLMLGKIEGRRRRGQQRMRWLDGITDSVDIGLGELGSWWWTGRPAELWSRGSQRVGHDWATELNWTERRSNQSILKEISPSNEHSGLKRMKFWPKDKVGWEVERGHIVYDFEFQSKQFLFYYIGKTFAQISDVVTFEFQDKSIHQGALW